jgi:hypothetical protein
METQVSDLPAPHAEFLARALPRLREDSRLVGVAAAGSYLTKSMDEFSDVDLVVAVEPSDTPAVSSERMKIVASLGPLLAAFTGEHVGEPRVMICLYGPPLLHVDLKFVSLDDVAARVEEPEVLWERDGRLSAALGRAAAHYPEPDLQWIEDRFWVWVHYGAAKIGRGELFEAHDFLAFLRMQVLGPLGLLTSGARPTGVRKIETLAPELAEELKATLGSHGAAACGEALASAVRLYRMLREKLAAPHLVRREAAETAAVAYLDEVRSRIG